MEPLKRREGFKFGFTEYSARTNWEPVFMKDAQELAEMVDWLKFCESLGFGGE